MWFEELVGFKEESPQQVRRNLKIEDTKLISLVNGKSYQAGRLEIASLKSLKQSAPALSAFNQKISVSEIVGDVQTLHRAVENEGALFQAASQFNLLEMVSPNVSPELGVGIYEHDFTQGPACAIACGAGTIYRNYFVELDGQTGQSSHQQVDCLANIGAAFIKAGLPIWEMRNGYALANESTLTAINQYLFSLPVDAYIALKEELKIGIQWNTEVTTVNKPHLVTQAYCSAFPVAYSDVAAAKWESLARLILEASYEATFYAALQNYTLTGKRKVYLTLVGGSAFGNPIHWILEAIENAICTFSNTPLEVQIVSFGISNWEVKALAQKMNE